MDKVHHGKVAIVTGAGNGIGAVIAGRMARDGANLVLADLDATGVAATAAAIRAEYGVLVETVAGDLSLEDTARAVVDKATECFGHIDILVNNAGGGVIRPFLAQTPETLRATIDRNLWTVLWCCWLTLPVMQAQKFGRIINLGADSVRNGLWDHAAYNAAKGGVHALTTGLAREFAGDGITVNTVAPCAVNTPQMQAIVQNNPALAEKFVSVIPLGRPAEMEEVASMISYLAGAEAAFVTGQVISVNGGSTML